MRWNLTDRNPQRGGDEGDDPQIVDYAVRWVGMPNVIPALTDQHLYPVCVFYAYAQQQDGGWVRGTEVERTLCTDPADVRGTHLWTKSSYSPWLSCVSRDEAIRSARATAVEVLARNSPVDYWDGHVHGGPNRG